MGKTTAAGFLAISMICSVAHADVSDEKPWNWADLSSAYLRNKDDNGYCDAIAADMKQPDLQCAFDKKAWDDHLKKELKVEKISQRNQQNPNSCGNGGFQAFRSGSSNGNFPDGADAEAVKIEFRKQVSVIACTFDDVDKDPFVTYDAAKRTLALHFTRKPTWNSSWVLGQLWEGELKKRFAALDKYFRKYE